MNKTDTRPVVEAFYGISSPWAYLGFPKLRQIVAQEGASLILRPIRIIQANGGIPLRTRPVARQEYHRVELRRWRDFLHLPLNLNASFIRAEPSNPPHVWLLRLICRGWMEPDFHGASSPHYGRKTGT